VLSSRVLPTLPPSLLGAGAAAAEQLAEQARTEAQEAKAEGRAEVLSELGHASPQGVVAAAAAAELEAREFEEIAEALEKEVLAEREAKQRESVRAEVAERRAAAAEQALRATSVAAATTTTAAAAAAPASAVTPSIPADDGTSDTPTQPPEPGTPVVLPSPAEHTAAAADSPLPVLPPGWQALVSRTSGQTYYANYTTGETRWEWPQSSMGEQDMEGSAGVEDVQSSREDATGSPQSDVTDRSRGSDGLSVVCSSLGSAAEEAAASAWQAAQDVSAHPSDNNQLQSAW
jgi:hypothetical protein